MSDATHGFAIHRPDPEFGQDYGRAYALPGESIPRIGLARGWWLVPSLAFGLAGWGFLIQALFF